MGNIEENEKEAENWVLSSGKKCRHLRKEDITKDVLGDEKPYITIWRCPDCHREWSEDFAEMTDDIFRSIKLIDTTPDDE